MQNIESVSRSDIQGIVIQLDQALYNHNQWYNLLIRSLVCRLPADKHDLDNNAHRECRFGQWYYGTTMQFLLNHPGFAAIGNSHQRMHQLATNLLQSASSHSQIAPIDYDQFANQLDQMRLEIYTLKNELEFYLYNRDALTGALTRVSMLSTLREQQEVTKRQQQSCSIAMVDIDLFKSINDTYGHEAGDKVLAEVAKFINSNLRPYDKLFRFGGEEFLVCLPFTTIEQSKEIMERILTGVRDLTISIDNEKQINCTISIGLSHLIENSPVEVSIENADKAVYAAKSKGRNQLVVAT